MGFYTAEELDALDFPDTEVVAGGIHHTRGRILIGGEPGIGKSYLALQMLWELARGVPLLGLWPVRRAMSGLYVQAEVSEPLLQKRTRTLWGRNPPPNVALWTTDDDADENLTIVGKREEILEASRDYEMVAIDPLYSFTDGDENQVHTVRPTLKALNVLRREGRSLTLVHHVRKSQGVPRAGMDMLRGSSVWPGFVETIFLLQGEGVPGLRRRVKLHLLKARNRQEPLPGVAWILEWQPATEVGPFFRVVGEDQSGDAVGILYQLIEEVQEEFSRKDLVAEMIRRGFSRSAAYRAVNVAVQSGVLEEGGARLRRKPDNLGT